MNNSSWQPNSKKFNFPSIYRSITDTHGFFVCISVVLLVFVIVLSVLLYSQIRAWQGLQRERSAINQEIEFWEKIAKQYSNYRDAYFRLAVLNYKLGDRERAKDYLQNVFLIDPLFEEGRELERMLNSK